MPSSTIDINSSFREAGGLTSTKKEEILWRGAITYSAFGLLLLQSLDGEISRAIQKERKVYLWDIPRIEDESRRFENMVATELCRAVTQWNDLGFGKFSLHFIKNKEKQEVDFLIAPAYQ